METAIETIRPAPALARDLPGRWPLAWPLALYTEGVARVRARGMWTDYGAYPIRLLRYWYTACLLEVEHARRRHLNVVDMGCERGATRSFCPPQEGTRWVGLDLRADRIAALRGQYDELHCCDLDQPLPLPDAGADVVVFLHVIEHLQHPQAALAEIQRVLRPGGLLIAASPVLPMPLARLRQAQFGRELASGRRSIGQHINVFWQGRWKRALARAGLQCEMTIGGYLGRSARNPLENTRWWVRANQMWGALMTCWSNEIFVTARKPG